MKISTALLSAGFTLCVIHSSLAQDNLSEDDKSIKFLAIQHAISGSVSKTNQDSFSLELNDISNSTILFSDRPDRIVRSLSTSDFIGNWSTGENSFSADPPNAVLVIDDVDGIQFDSVVELSDPNYDSSTNTLKYDIVPDGSISVDLPSEFGRSTLVIDANTGFANSGSDNIGFGGLNSGHNSGIYGGSARGGNDRAPTPAR